MLEPVAFTELTEDAMQSDSDSESDSDGGELCTAIFLVSYSCVSLLRVKALEFY